MWHPQKVSTYQSVCRVLQLCYNYWSTTAKNNFYCKLSPTRIILGMCNIYYHLTTATKTAETAHFFVPGAITGIRRRCLSNCFFCRVLQFCSEWLLKNWHNFYHLLSLCYMQTILDMCDIRQLNTTTKTEDASEFLLRVGPSAITGVRRRRLSINLSVCMPGWLSDSHPRFLQAVQISQMPKRHFLSCHCGKSWTHEVIPVIRSEFPCPIC